VPGFIASAFAKSSPSAKSSPPANASHRFSPPTALDTLLDADPIPFPAVKPANVQPDENTAPPSTYPDTVPSDNRGTSSASNTPGVFYQIQLDAISDVDVAQTRKAALEQELGSKIDMVFDPPFYKLRYGNFSTKEEAEDALADLAEKNVQGFVVRQ
jgi:septal ring-binding cell division protein DamX